MKFHILAAVIASLFIHQPAVADQAIEPLVGFEVGPTPNGSTLPSRAPFYLHTDGFFYGTMPGGGAFANGALIRMSKRGVIDGLSFSGSYTNRPGGVPASTPVLGSDGWLWGTTSTGGVTTSFGTVFRVNPTTGESQTMHNFASGGLGNAPVGGLVADGQGNLWGVTQYSNNGTSTNGIIYKINELTGVFSLVRTFPGTLSSSANGRVPQGGLYYDGAGNLWGTTSLGGTYGYGTVFKYTISNDALTNVALFSGSTVVGGAIKGSGAVSALVPDGNGFLWGVTPYGGSSLGNGTVFKVEMATGTATSVLEFSDNGTTNKGANPVGPLVNDGAGYLWGVTNAGATGGKGSVFKISHASGVLTTVFQFGSLSGANINVRTPINGLTSDGQGNLWGLATFGGGAATWTVYKIRIADGAFTKVVEQPPGGVTYQGGTPLAGLSGNATSPWLWGTTSAGGLNNLGTLFRYNPATGRLDTAVHFTGTTGTAMGSKATGRLYVDAGGIVWGTTAEGGTSNLGTIFKFDPATGIFTTIQSFSSAGIRPKGALVGLSDGYIWGTTSDGLSGNAGTVFKINPATNAVTIVYSFSSSNSTAIGTKPLCGLAEDGNGFVWGTTQYGGASTNGTLFKIEMATGTLTAVRSFASGTGSSSGDMVVDPSGNVWGTGATRVFKYVPATSTYTDVFVNEDVMAPRKSVFTGSLFKTAAGEIRFLGTEGTQDLPSPNNNYIAPRAVIYQINTATNVVTKVRSLMEGVVGPFTAAELVPAGGLYEHTDGRFYGITQSGGTDDRLEPVGGGMIYRVGSGPSAMTQRYNSPTTTAFYSLVSGTTVTLRGYVNPNGNATTCQFEWGPTSALGNTVNASAVAGTGYTGGLCEAILTGLPANTTYFFRVRANSTGAPSYGPIRTVVTGAGVPPTNAEIAVESPIGQSLVDNVTTVDLGARLVGRSYQQSVAVRNLSTGAGVGLLSGLTATITGANADDFVITIPLGVTSLPYTQMSTGLLVTFTPGGVGARTALLTITSNDADEGTFRIPLTGMGTLQPEIEVDSPAAEALLSGMDTYDYGSGAINAGIARTFTIRNTGNTALTSLNVTVDGISSSEYAVTTQPPASIAPGGSGTFTVTFTPSLGGSRNATLQIASNDTDENPFGINVTGTGINAPEIEVLDNSINLIDGLSVIAFGDLAPGAQITRQITIRNAGNMDLTGIGLSLTGANTADFLVSTVAASVPAGQQITFNLSFFPQALGAKTATLRVASNDSDENPFDIALTGAGAVLTAADLWRQTWFGSAGNTGNAADNADPDGDGYSNLLEFALGMSPTLATTPSLQTVITGGNIEYTYTRSKTAVQAGVTYQVPWSDSLANPVWHYGDTVQQVIADNGTIQTVKATIPAGASGGRFVRLEVTSN